MSSCIGGFQEVVHLPAALLLPSTMMRFASEASFDPRSMPAPAEARRSSQLKAVLRKNVLLKRRAWKTSCCEILSPALFLSILVLGYYLSDITYIAAANYSMTTLFFGPFLEALAPLARASSTGASAGASSLAGDAMQCMAQGGNASAGCASDGLNLMQLRGSLDSLLQGPLPVLPIDLYLGVGLAAQSLLGPANYRLLTEVDSYLRAFGNLLTPGTLHLAPNTRDVRRFLNASYARHPTLHNITVRVHATEDDALSYILDPPDPTERTWALLSFRSLDAATVDYSIRLNYSTVPNTNRITRFIARGIDTTFQRYSTSGYLTLQSLVVSRRASHSSLSKGGTRSGNAGHHKRAIHAAPHAFSSFHNSSLLLALLGPCPPPLPSPLESQL